MEKIGESIPQVWFAVQVRPQAEKSVAAIARYNGFEEFLPLCRSQTRWPGRVQSLDVPLFPGYLFCRISPDVRLQLQTIPGVRSIVGDGKTPIPVDDTEMAALRATARSGLPVEPWPLPRNGNRVRLKGGPLTGLQGLLVAVRESYRLVLSISVLDRSIAVEIEPGWATPLRLPRPKGASDAFPQPLAERSTFL